MTPVEKLRRSLQQALKINGFSIRREFCSFIVDKFIEEDIDLNDKAVFESCLKQICISLEKQCSVDRSIEREHVEQAVEACLHTGYDRHETIFNVINAFDFPKFSYDIDRKLFFHCKRKCKFLTNADAKAELFMDRYSTILQKTKRNFVQRHSQNENENLKLQTVDYLLTMSYVTLEHTLILGSLLQVSEGVYHLEDPTGTVLLDLTHAKYDSGFFAENTFVLVTGYYEDKILHVSTMATPPGEIYENSRPSFGTLNYFGGISNIPLKDSSRLKDHLYRRKHDMILFISDLWLDSPGIIEKLEMLFKGLHAAPPIAFVFIGDFISETHGNEVLDSMKKLFRKLGELINNFPNLVKSSNFVFVPGMNDPCTPHIVPRLPLPPYISNEMTAVIPKAVFTTNPCRLQYCTKEITVFRGDLMSKLLQGTLHKPQKHELPFCVSKTIIGQGHLSPMSLNALTVHWDFDHTLRLYPVPDLVVIGDKCEPYQEEYKGCVVINPGSFCDNGFQFKSYTPATNTVDDCVL